MTEFVPTPGFKDMLSFGLLEALLGRRSRRSFMGAEIPDGVFAYTSRTRPVPLTGLEEFLIVAVCGGHTSWHHMIYRAAHYAPHLPNYSAAAGGRVFPSSVGFHTSQTFFADDEGLYMVEMRDTLAFEDPPPPAPMPRSRHASSQRQQTDRDHE